MGSHHFLSHILLAISSLCLLAGSDVYIVGDENGWSTGTNYLLWSEKYNFTVGDVLVFNYVKGQHNVYQVTEEPYRSCDSGSGVIQTYTSGGDRVNLTEVAKYWFICNVKGHCKGGMRFGVTAASSSGRGSHELAVPPTPPAVVPGNSAAAGGRIGLWGWGVVAFDFLYLMNY